VPLYSEEVNVLTRQEVVDAIYDACPHLRGVPAHLPEKLKMAAIELFISGEQGTTNVKVIREALKILQATGFPHHD
jgi:hypothetical protein